MRNVNDAATVRAEYAAEGRFLARRLSTWASLHGQLIENELVAAVQSTGATRVIDVGCGTGDFTERLTNAVAMDLSPRMAELTHRRSIPACVGDIEALPLASGSFDCIVANRVLYHLPDLERGLAEIGRVLRPGGVLVASTYFQTHLQELADALGRQLIGTTFSAETAMASLQAHFDDVAQRDVVGTARFASLADVRSFAAQTFGDASHVDVRVDVPIPFEATYRHALFVATRRVQA